MALLRKKKYPDPCRSLLPVRVTMFTAPTLVMPVDRSKLADDNWNSSTTSCEKFIPVLPSMLLRMLPPSTVIAVLLESPPRIDTENSELYRDVDPGLAVTPGSRNAS